MKIRIVSAVVLCICFLITACSGSHPGGNSEKDSILKSDVILEADNGEEVLGENHSDIEKESQDDTEMYTRKTKISDVINDQIFGDYGRLIFPVESSYYSGDTLENLRLTWYNNIDPDMTVAIVNYMKDSVTAGQTIFYDIYTEQEKRADPAKADTGLFFFKGREGEKFALIYRPGAQTACEDLSRALTFIFENADELGVSTDDYSLWGGSAGARMAAWVGSYGTEAFGEQDLPQPAAVVMQYTGLSEYSRNDPPTFVTVGESDGIADWRIMKRRLDGMSDLGIPTEFHSYTGLSHGFGIGTGTIAQGWLDQAIDFWEVQSSQKFMN